MSPDNLSLPAGRFRKFRLLRKAVGQVSIPAAPLAAMESRPTNLSPSPSTGWSPRQQIRLALLRLAARWSPGGRPGEMSGPPRSILLIRPDHLGDLLFTAPALRHLRDQWPAAHLTLLTGPWSKAVAEGIPHLDEVIICDFPWFSRRPRRWALEPYQLLRQEARRLRPRAFDLSITLRFDHWWGAWLAHWAGIPRRWGYDLPEVSPFLTQPVSYAPGRHEVLQNLSLTEAVTGTAASPADRALEFRPSDVDRDSAGELLAAEGILGDDPFVCVHPGTGAPVKLWRNEAWAEVIEALRQEYGVKIVITGGPGEVDLVHDLAEQLAVPAIDLAGRTNLGQLAAALERSRMVLGVDSGPLHLAVAMGTPTVHLFGPVDVRLFGPWGDPQKHLVVVSNRDCAPCNRLDYGPEELPAHPCVREIAIEPVLEAARRLLGSPA